MFSDAASACRGQTEFGMKGGEADQSFAVLPQTYCV